MNAQQLAKALHYPQCWDTAAYPTVESALAEVAATFRCTNQDTHELVTRGSAEQAIEHVSQHNGPGREAEARGMLVHLDAADPSPRIGAIVAKMRADLQALGGFDNGMLSVPAEGVRTYIERLEAALAAPSQPQGEQQVCQRCKHPTDAPCESDREEAACVLTLAQPQGEQSTAPSDVREQAREQCPYASAPHRGYWIEGYCYRAARAQSTAPESPQAAAQSTALEPARWESRVWMDGCGGEPVGWGDWETVKPRNPNMDTVADRVAEFKSLIAAGYRYELRPLYATPSAAMALLGEARAELADLMEVAERCDSWQSFPNAPLEKARAFIARIDALTGTGRKEQSNG